MSGRRESAILTISRFEWVPSRLQNPVSQIPKKHPPSNHRKNSACHALFLLIYNESFN
jgi:hypothetical protein